MSLPVDGGLGERGVLHAVRPAPQHLAGAQGLDVGELRLRQQHHVGGGDQLVTRQEAGHDAGQVGVGVAEPDGVAGLERDRRSQVGVQRGEMVRVQGQPVLVLLRRRSHHPEGEERHGRDQRFLFASWSMELEESVEFLSRFSARFSLMDFPDFLDIPWRGDLSLMRDSSDGEPEWPQVARLRLLRAGNLLPDMLERFRDFWVNFWKPVAHLLIRLGVTPNMVTFFGTLGVAAGALVFFPRGELLIGVIVITLFVFSDLIDGYMARLDRQDVEVRVVLGLHARPDRRRRDLRRSRALLRRPRRQLPLPVRDPLLPGDGRRDVVRAGQGGVARPHRQGRHRGARGPAGRRSW